MPENLTAHQFFKAYCNKYSCSYDDMAEVVGQACITDNTDLETSWNKFVMAYQELDRHFDKWETG